MGVKLRKTVEKALRVSAAAGLDISERDGANVELVILRSYGRYHMVFSPLVC